MAPTKEQKSHQGDDQIAGGDYVQLQSESGEGEQPLEALRRTLEELQVQRREFAAKLGVQDDEWPALILRWLNKTRILHTCSICGEERSREQFIGLTGCSHESDTCVECFDHWINAQLETVTWDKIRCPSNGCGITVQHNDVLKHATPETFARFDTAAALSVFNNDPDFRWCRRPGCKAGHIHSSGEEGNIFTCRTCDFRVCVIHDSEWHEDETCAEYDLRLAKGTLTEQKLQEEMDLAEVARISKKCPGKGCGWNIEKDGGCDHMTCRRCRHEFCWECLAPYERINSVGNEAHSEECSYHTARLARREETWNDSEQEDEASDGWDRNDREYSW